MGYKGMKIALIGCGLIGEKRIRAAKDHEIVFLIDRDESRAQLLKEKTALHSAQVGTDWKRAIESIDVEAVIVATTHEMLTPISKMVVEAGKHLLVEKPVARSLAEIETLVQASRYSKAIVKVGFNHRFHSAFLQAKRLIESGCLGPLMYIRARYGHGGRLGYEKEWRAKRDLSGGGELIDQGIHLIDLSRSFLGEFTEVYGEAETYFWPMEVEDNVFLSLKTSDGKRAWLHASWTEWKNLFCFEIFGRNGKLQIDGLGGSYGPETLTLYQMKPQMGPPEIQKWSFEGSDQSWQLEIEEWVRAIHENRPPLGNLRDARESLEIIDQIYGKVKV